jgi:hypothetical protein
MVSFGDILSVRIKVSAEKSYRGLLMEWPESPIFYSNWDTRLEH